MDGAAVLRAVDECESVLGPAVDRDWTRQAANVDWSVAKTVAHIAESLLWYASDMAAGPAELSSMDLTVPVDKAPAELLRTVRTFGVVLARVLDAAAPEDRGWHPFGLPDASGFAGSACDEIVIHTADAAAGLGLDFAPSADLALYTARLHSHYVSTAARRICSRRGQPPWPVAARGGRRTGLPARRVPS